MPKLPSTINGRIDKRQPLSLSPYQQHVKKWGNGCGASICQKAKHICLGRGVVPCDIVFIGEAPGKSENAVGKPFVGPAGKLLDYIISKSIPEDLTYAITNLVGCMPTDPDKPGKAGQPYAEDIYQCAPRLEEFIKIADPKLIICVGSLAKDFTKQGFQGNVKINRNIPIEYIIHPASILRLNIAMRSIKIQQCMVDLSDAIENHFPSKD